MKVQQYQFLIVILILFYLLDVESQCDGNIQYENSVNFILTESRFDNVVADCLPDLYKDYQPSMWFYYNNIEGDHTAIKANDAYHSSLYSQCGFNINGTYVNKCNNNNCVSSSDMIDYLETYGNIQSCKYKLNSNISMSSVGYGYYINNCNTTLYNQLYIKYECKCNNLYQLTFYSSDQKCLFRTSLIENNTYFDKKINCSINQCTDNEIVDNDNMNAILEHDYRCIDECITESIIIEQTSITSSVNKKIIINKVVFMMIIIIINY